MSFARLPALAAAMVAGILLADRAAASFVIALCAGAVSVVCLFTAFVTDRSLRSAMPGELHPKLSPRAVALTLIGGLTFGFAVMGLEQAGLKQAKVPSYDGRVIEVRGKVVTDPVRAGRGLSFTLRVDQAGPAKVRERVHVRLFGGRPPELGDIIRAHLKVRPLDSRNDFDRSLSRRQVVAKASLSRSLMRTVDSSPGPLLSTANRIRNEMGKLARKALDPPEAGLVLGLTIGDDTSMPDRLKEDFRTTSLSHLTAVSGTNVAIVLGAALLVLRGMKLSRRTQIVVGLAVILLFGAVTRWEPSVFRATIMASLALGAFLFGRLYDPRQGLVLAFLGLLAVDPMLLWSVGFQLSFAATAGLLLITPRLTQHFRGLPRWVGEVLAVALGAQLAVTPLLAFHFGRISLVSIPANLAAFPLVAPITVLGLMGAAVGFLWEPAGLALLEAGGLFARGLGWLAHTFASVPRASIPISRIGPVHLVAAYAAMLAVVLWMAGRGRSARRMFISVLVLASSILWMGPGVSAPTDGVRVTFFDVGQGDSALIESPSGARVLVDGGPDTRQIASELGERGIKRLDLVVFSHAHLDHINGLGAVMASKQIRLAVHPGIRSAWIDRLPPDHRPVPTSEGEVFTIGDLTAEMLGPSSAQRDDAAINTEQQPGEGSALNDASVVIRITWQKACVLFTGDIEEPAQQVLTQNHRRGIDCGVVKAPHHGSARLDPEFVAAADPEWVVISVGQNTFGHPSRTALGLFERAGAHAVRTDQRGDVVLVIDAHGRVSIQE